MRTIKEIKDEMTAAFIADVNVRAKYDPTNTWSSSTTFESVFAAASLESILFYIVSVCAYGLEFLFGKHKVEVGLLEDKMRVGTKEWWRQLCFNFQLGYNLVFNSTTNTYEYTVNDDEAKIIKFVDVKETTKGIVIVVNEADNDGNPIKMDTVDLTNRNAFNQYIKKTKITGIPMKWNSYNPDKLRILLTVLVDPLVINALGEKIIDGTKPVELAINNYLQNIPFGSSNFNKTQLIDSIQNAEGVVDVYPSSTDWLYVSTDYNPLYIPVSSQNITAYGGSFKVDSLTINYTSHV